MWKCGCAFRPSAVSSPRPLSLLDLSFRNASARRAPPLLPPRGPRCPPRDPPRSTIDTRLRCIRKRKSRVRRARARAGRRRGARGSRCPSWTRAALSTPNLRAPSRRLFQTRRGYSLHCWLPAAGERAPLRTNNGLSVLGCAIIPELKPRVPTMSERDLTRVYTPRHYLRS